MADDKDIIRKSTAGGIRQKEQKMNAAARKLSRNVDYVIEKVSTSYSSQPISWEMWDADSGHGLVTTRKEAKKTVTMLYRQNMRWQPVR